MVKVYLIKCSRDFNYIFRIYNVAFHHLNSLTTLFLGMSNIFCFKRTFMCDLYYINGCQCNRLHMIVKQTYMYMKVR